jgi:DNA-binding IclR family transcriptional regulator
MRHSAPWMIKEDDRILEYLRQEGWASPSLLVRQLQIDLSPNHVKERLHMLQYAGLVARLTQKYWELTTRGIHYLRGDLDVRHQPYPTRDRVFG